MAIQTDPQRFAGWAEFMREIPPGESYTVNKPDLRAAYDAIDQYFSDNAATINQALPVAARTDLSTPEKARLLIRVVRDRYLNGV